jgi:sec-independent protein translocase protein TatC
MGFLRKLFIPADGNPDEVRMTLGEHLDELRSRLIRALIALFVGTVICYIFIEPIESFLIWPVFVIYKAHGYEPEILTLHPSEAFMTSLKVAILIGLMVSAPFSLSQIWGFVAAGLYPKERAWVRSFAPVSIALFFAGAIFLVVAVNPLLLNFLLNYQTKLPDVSRFMPRFLITAAGVDTIKVAHPSTEPAADLANLPRVPAFQNDPAGDIPEGAEWFNLTERERRVQLGGKIYRESHLEVVGSANRVRPQLRLEEIIPFTLGLAAAFGVGFQVPVVVAFIAAIGIISAADMARYRRHVIFAMSIAAAIITPSPDPFSMCMLLGPMIGLYEAGLYAARRIERNRAAQQSNAV